MRRIIAVIIISLTPIFARADYHYVSHEGSDTYPYTSWETAADSIQAAVDATSPGDTLFIASGVWEESVVLGFYDSLSIIGAGWDSTFLYTEEYQTAALHLGDGCYTEGMNLRSGWNGANSYVGADIKINSCKFISSLAGAAIQGGNSEIVNCLIDSCEIGILSPGRSANVLLCLATRITMALVTGSMYRICSPGCRAALIRHFLGQPRTSIAPAQLMASISPI
jgi:hypothetical protein